jgi:hypothetical protein
MPSLSEKSSFHECTWRIKVEIWSNGWATALQVWRLRFDPQQSWPLCIWMYTPSACIMLWRINQDVFYFQLSQFKNMSLYGLCRHLLSDSGSISAHRQLFVRLVLPRGCCADHADRRQSGWAVPSRGVLSNGQPELHGMWPRQVLSASRHGRAVRQLLSRSDHF